MTPARFVPGDCGLHFPDSQEINWNPHTGQRANEYEAWARIVYLHFVIEPRVIRLVRDLFPWAVHSFSSIPTVDVGKFIIDYVLRPLRSGQPYFVGPNYLWDIPQNWLRNAAQLIKSKLVAPHPAITPGYLQLFNLHVAGTKYVDGDTTYTKVAHVSGGDTSHLLDGIIEKNLPTPALTPEQCNLIGEAERTHDARDAAILAHDWAQAEALAPAAMAAQLAFEAAARTPREQTMFLMIFCPDIDLKAPLLRIDALTDSIVAQHMAWHDAFGCESHTPPDYVRVIETQLAHARAHFLRACYVPGMVLRTVCGSFIDSCPDTDT